jgi:hypothetical protein
VALPVGRESDTPLRRERSSARRTRGTREDEGEAGTEKPTTDEVGNVDLEVEAEPASLAGWRSKDAKDLLRTGGAAPGAGADGDVGVGAGVGPVEVDTAEGGVEDTMVSSEGGETTAEGSGIFAGSNSGAVREAATPVVGSHDSDLDLTCECAVPAAETEVLEERGDEGTGGVSDTVEISVSEEATVSGRSLRGDSAESEASLSGSSRAAFVDEGSGGAATMALGVVPKCTALAGLGDSGGVGRWRALSRTPCGGRERGEKMIPGARDGSVGRRDQIAQPPSCCPGFGDMFGGFVDVDVEAGAGIVIGAGREMAGTVTWGVDGCDPEAWREREGRSDGGGAGGGDEGEAFGAGELVEGSGTSEGS